MPETFCGTRLQCNHMIISLSSEIVPLVTPKLKMYLLTNTSNKWKHSICGVLMVLYMYVPQEVLGQCLEHSCTTYDYMETRLKLLWYWHLNMNIQVAKIRKVTSLLLYLSKLPPCQKTILMHCSACSHQTKSIRKKNINRQVLDYLQTLAQTNLSSQSLE